MSESSQEKGILIEFFSQFPNFVYDPNQPATSEFKRLCKSSGWVSSGSLLSELEDAEQTKERKRAEKLFRNALVNQFNSIYGTDEDRLEAWKDLCGRLGVSEIPDTLTECRKIVTSTHVNLIDLIDGGTARTFENVFELSKYTKRQKKFFPRNNANAGNLLKYLLRHIARPSLDIGRFDGTGNRIVNESKTGQKSGRRSRARRSAKDELLGLIDSL